MTKKKRKVLFTEDDILAHGKMRSMGISKKESFDRILLSKKIKNLTRRKK